MAELQYPLEQIIEVKENRVKSQEKKLLAAEREYQERQKELFKAEKLRNQVLRHYNAKMSQLRHMMDVGGYSPEFEGMKRYLKLVEEKLKAEELKVKAEEKKVKEAREERDKQESLLHQRRLELDKIQEHRQLWLQEQLIEFRLNQINEQDDIGTLIYLNQRSKSAKH